MTTMTITNMLTRKPETPPQEALMTSPALATEHKPGRSYNLHDDTFAAIGFNEAMENGANPDTYQLMLRRVLSAVEVETHDTRDLSRREAAELEQELAGLTAEEAKLKGETLPALQQEYRQVENRYNEVKSDPEKLSPGELAHDTSRLTMSLYGMISLSCFLYIFYFIVGHAAFVRNIGKGLENADAGSVSVLFESVFDASAIVRDLASAPMNLLFCIFFPLVFMVVGYLFHEFHDKGKARLAWGCLGVIFGLDCTMAYKVSAKAHEARFLSGITDEPWRFSMILSDVTFYMILLAGMAVYLIWGALVNLFFDEKRRSNRLFMFLDGCETKLDALTAEMKKVEERLTAIERKMKEKQLRAAQLDEPGMLAVFPWHRIEQVMDSFTAGWARGVAAHYKEVRERLVEEEKLRSGELPLLLERCKNAIKQSVDQSRRLPDERG